MNFGLLINEVKGGKMYNKKALSDVVTIVLIILLALAAVGIIWSFIRPTIERSGTGIDLAAECFKTDVAPTTCRNNSLTTATINVQLKKGNPSEVIAILEFTDGSTLINRTSSINILETKALTFAWTNKIVKSAKAAAVITSTEGESATCDPSPVVIECSSA